MVESIKKELANFIKVEIITEILSSSIFKSLVAIENEKDIVECLDLMVAKFAVHKLRPWGIPLIIICNLSDNCGKKYYVLDSFLKTELEKYFKDIFKEGIINSKEAYKKIYREIDSESLPWFASELGDDADILEVSFEVKDEAKKCYVWSKVKNIFGEEEIKEILKITYDNILRIIDNYKEIKNKIEEIEKKENIKKRIEYNPEWLFNSLADHALITSLSIMELKDLLDGFFLMLWKYESGEILMKYLPRSWQKYNLNSIIKEDSFDILIKNGYPPQIYQSGFSLVTGITQVGNPLGSNIAKKNQNENENKYPQELLDVENKIWDADKYKIIYAPLNENIMNRFLIALRIPKDNNDNNIDNFKKIILERFVNKVSYQIKLAFCESLLPKGELSQLKFLLYEEDELPKSLTGDNTGNYKAIEFSFYNDFLQNSIAIRELIEKTGKIEAAYNVSHFLKNTIERRRLDFIAELKKNWGEKDMAKDVLNIINKPFYEIQGLTSLINVSVRGYFRKDKECENINICLDIPETVGQILDSYKKLLDVDYKNFKRQSLVIKSIDDKPNDVVWLLPKKYFWQAVISEWINDMLIEFSKLIKESIIDVFYFIDIIKIEKNILTFSLLNPINESRLNYINKTSIQEEYQEYNPEEGSGKGAIKSFFNILMKDSCKFLIIKNLDDFKTIIDIKNCDFKTIIDIKNMEINSSGRNVCWFALILKLDKNKLNIKCEG